ncbi:hypothetical protein JYT61_01285, partial [bacterium AH-315-E10]|nr:hypothetical protein [bacterium AH-315-E10]
MVLLCPFSVLALLDQPKVSTSATHQEGKIVLKAINLTAIITGPFVHVDALMVFHNPTDDILAGHFSFPLPETATVTSYALDVQGKMVDAVVVEKDHARVAFKGVERLRRRQKFIDPGILEKKEGNEFQTHIYPFFGKRSRSIRVSYVYHLSATNNEYQFELPLPYQNVEIITARVEIRDINGVPKVKGPAAMTYGGMTAKLIINGKDLKKKSGIRVSFKKTSSIFLERSKDGHVYYAVTGHPQDPWKNVRKAPERIH